MSATLYSSSVNAFSMWFTLALSDSISLSTPKIFFIKSYFVGSFSIDYSVHVDIVVAIHIMSSLKQILSICGWI